jgi:hypothetical protein
MTIQTNEIGDLKSAISNSNRAAFKSNAFSNVNTPLNDRSNGKVQRLRGLK